MDKPVCFTNEELIDALPYLWTSAFNLTKDKDDADDLLQDTVERALTRRHMFTEGMPIRPWLVRLCRNHYIDQTRKRRITTVSDDIAMESVPDGEASQETKVYTVQVLQKVMQLPDHEWCVMDAQIDTDSSYSELSRKLEIPLGTMKIRMSRARARLTRELEEE